MARPRLVTQQRASRLWLRLWSRLGKRPTVAQFRKALGVRSTRTAFRYLQQIDRGEMCPHCGGRGWLRP